MKRILLFIAVVITVSAGAQNIFPKSGAVGIGTTTPNAASLLDICSTSKGILIPRMTVAQRNAIKSPPMGLMIFQTNITTGFYYYNGSAWVMISTGSSAGYTAGTGINISGTTISNTAPDKPVTITGTGNATVAGTYPNFTIDAASVPGPQGDKGDKGDIGDKGDKGDIGLTGATGEQGLPGIQGVQGDKGDKGDAGLIGAAGEQGLTGAQGETGLQGIQGDKGDKGDIGDIGLTGATGEQGLPGIQGAQGDKGDKGDIGLTGAQGIQGPAGLLQNGGSAGNTPYWNGTSWVVNSSNIFNNGGNIGIGTTTPAFRLEVSGDASINGITVGKGGGSQSNNTVAGHQALYSNTFGNYNVASGYQALYSNTIGIDNVANGYNALYSNTIGIDNVASGSQALFSNTTGNGNVASGFRALFSNTTGIQNVASGYASLQNNTTGNQNVASGPFALNFNITGNQNTALGYSANVASGDLSNATVIGNSANVNASNKVVIGNTAVTVIGGQVGWSILSDGRFKSNIKENVPGLEFIKKLKPVTYNLQLQKFDKFLGKKDSLIKANAADYAKGEKKIHTGFVAQDVEKAAQELKYDFDGVNHPQNDKDNYSLVYADFVPSLVKAVQELSATNDAKDAKIDTLEKQNERLQKEFEDLRALVLSVQQKQESCSPCGTNSASSLQTTTAFITDADAASLQQNVPNPFNNTTIINYTLPQTYSSAKIVVVDKNGKMLKEINVTGSGKGSLKLEAATLSSGAYHYSLYVNGRLIDTKQMVLAR